jgi:hypothetical protein
MSTLKEDAENHQNMFEVDDESLTVPKEQIEFMLLKANIELMQRVNRMIELLEKQSGVEE